MKGKFNKIIHIFECICIFIINFIVFDFLHEYYVHIISIRPS